MDRPLPSAEPRRPLYVFPSSPVSCSGRLCVLFPRFIHGPTHPHPTHPCAVAPQPSPTRPIPPIYPPMFNPPQLLITPIHPNSTEFLTLGHILSSESINHYTGLRQYTVSSSSPGNAFGGFPSYNMACFWGVRTYDIKYWRVYRPGRISRLLLLLPVHTVPLPTPPHYYGGP